MSLEPRGGHAVRSGEADICPGHLARSSGSLQPHGPLRLRAQASPSTPVAARALWLAGGTCGKRCPGRTALETSGPGAQRCSGRLEPSPAQQLPSAWCSGVTAQPSIGSGSRIPSPTGDGGEWLGQTLPRHCMRQSGPRLGQIRTVGSASQGTVSRQVALIHLLFTYLLIYLKLRIMEGAGKQKYTHEGAKLTTPGRQPTTPRRQPVTPGRQPTTPRLQPQGSCC